MSPALRLNDRIFEEEVLGAGMPVLVEFGSSWCLACKAMEPLLDEVAEEYSGKARVARINVDQNPAWAGRFRVSGVPTFMIFVDSEEAERRVGALSKKQICGMIDSRL